MEFFLNRYRNLSVLLVVILAQLGLLAYQIKSSSDVRLIRVWAVTAMTPLARVIEFGRGGVSGFFHNYFILLDVREDNKHLRAQLDQAELDNQYLRAQLSTSDRAKALALFQATSQAKTLAARITGNTTDVGGATVIIDRGASSGVQKGMGVTTPEGIVGKVIEVYPTASYVLLITDPSFAASVVSQNNRVHGVVKGKDNNTAIVDYVQNEQKVDAGEEFMTSGEDRVFPKGYLVGQATVVKPGQNRKDILLSLSGMQNGLEDVLVILDNTPGPSAGAPLANQSVQLLPAPPPDPDAVPVSAPAPGAVVQNGGLMTDLDRQVQKDKLIGAAQNHTFGGTSPAPNFNIDLGRSAAAPAPASGTAAGGAQHP
jgi:rod shape-determining protein MreC